MKVWTYWECPYCNSMIQGKHRDCPNCGSPIPNDVKYLMPDNPKVIKALKDGTVILNGETNTDEKGIVSEIVKPEEEREKPNWLCPACGCQNFDDDDICKGCGHPRGSKTYFGESWDYDEPRQSETPDDTVGYCEADTECVKEFHENYDKQSHHEDNSNKFSDIKHSILSFVRRNKENIIYGSTITAVVLLVIGFLIWLFTPVDRAATVEGFSWSRSISVEQYTLCHENDWSVPYGGIVTDKREEIHHYDTVIDHYETKSKQVSEQVFDGYETETRTVTEQVFDGYDTSYRDLGNGQADVVQTPRYRTETHTEEYQVPKYHTEYHTEYYEEPVYKDVPVYKTMYYYDIGRWLYSTSLETQGFDQEPYWYDTDLPTDVENPEYGALRQTKRSETYTVHLINDEGEKYTTTFGKYDWSNLLIGDRLAYKSFRFSKKPLTEVVVEHQS